MKKILVINGPNMNMLGIREPEIYGRITYSSLCKMISEYCSERNIDLELFQSNHEGAIVDKIQQAYGNKDGIIINPAAYTHTSVAIRDAISAVGIPSVEVHISDVNNREEFRRINFISEVCVKTISGKGLNGYLEAIDYFCK